MDLADQFATIQGLPYRERRACLRDQTTYPRFLYKYRDIDSNTKDSDAGGSLERVRSVLVENELWLSSPLSFNDPFDMSARFTVAGTAKERRERMREWAATNGLSIKQTDQLLARMGRMGPEGQGALIRESHENTLRQTGVCSFAGDPKSILMWSHYARSHAGYCIGYEVARDPRSLMLAVSVEYSTEYPIVEWRGAFEGNEEFKKTLFWKYSGWEYERERRIIAQDRASQPLRIRAEAMALLILGCRIAAEDEKQLLGMLEERKKRGMRVPKVLRAVADSSSYALRLTGLRA